MHSARLAAALLVASPLIAGCIGQTPEEEERASLGQARDGDEEHRPGQPCLACHAEDYHPGKAVFAFAGTIYRTADDSDDHGLEGAQVSFIDAEDHEFVAVTNRVGNFMVRVDHSLDAPRTRTRGRTEIPWDPVPPITVAVIYEGVDKSMDSKIWREGSCAGCHTTSQPGVDHVEKVWHTEVSQ